MTVRTRQTKCPAEERGFPVWFSPEGSPQLGWCWSTPTSSCAKWWTLSGRRSRRRGSDPSPPRPAERGAPFSPRLVKAPAAATLSPGEGYKSSARARPAIFPTFSQGRRWTATGVLTSRRGPGRCPPKGTYVPLTTTASARRRVRGYFRRLDHHACPAQPWFGRYTAKWRGEADPDIPEPRFGIASELPIRPER